MVFRPSLEFWDKSTIAGAESVNLSKSANCLSNVERVDSVKLWLKGVKGNKIRLSDDSKKINIDNKFKCFFNILGLKNENLSKYGNSKYETKIQVWNC